MSDPKLLWVKMVERPGYSQAYGKNHLSLAWKFNKIIDELVENEEHPELSCIEVNISKTDFTFSGDLMSGGHYNFWKQFLNGFQNIDKKLEEKKRETPKDLANEVKHTEPPKNLKSPRKYTYKSGHHRKSSHHFPAYKHAEKTYSRPRNSSRYDSYGQYDTTYHDNRYSRSSHSHNQCRDHHRK